MKNEFYKYIKDEIKKIPNSAFIDVSPLYLKEDDFLSYLQDKKYPLSLINFSKTTKVIKTDYFDPQSEIVEIQDDITYHYKINNQLYLEYIVNNRDLKGNFPYTLLNITVYSSESNKQELISFLEYIGEYIKNNNK